MKTTHTPGPWQFQSAVGLVRIEPTAGGQIIGTLADSYYAAEQRDEQEANARLIAAAPSLLEACESAVDLDLECGATSCSDEEPCVGRLLRNAIAQARGTAVQS